jgi:flagellar motor switch protein FliG
MGVAQHAQACLGAARIAPRDLGLVIRQVEQPVLVTALTGSTTPEQITTRDFILGNISQRMADVLREEMAAVGRVGKRAAEEAMTQVVAAIRSLEEQGQISLIMPDEFE